MSDTRYDVICNVAVPVDKVLPEEIRLIQEYLGDLFLQIINEFEEEVR